MNDLRDRFEAISKGRSVRVNERQNTLFNKDFNVSYEEETASYLTEFTHHGHFEEAYCFIERWIKRHAEKLDGSYTPPPTGHIDCRGVGLYWMLERPFNRYWADVQDAIRQQYALLERERPNEGVTGEVTVESRLMALRGFLEFLKPVADDVQAAILSPSSVECLSVVSPSFVEGLVALGLDVPEWKIRKMHSHLAERSFLVLCRDWLERVQPLSSEAMLPRDTDTLGLSCLTLAVERGHDFTAEAETQIAVNRKLLESRGTVAWPDQIVWDLCLAATKDAP